LIKPWFDIEGKPLLWYSGGDGRPLKFFDLPVAVNPDTGEPLKPVTPQMRQIWEDKRAQQSREEAKAKLRNDAQQKTKTLAAEFRVASFPAGTEVTIIRASKNPEAESLARKLGSHSAGTVLGPHSAGAESIAKAILDGDIDTLSASGLLDRVARIRVVDLSANCRPTETVRGGTICVGSLEERSAQRSPRAVRRKQATEEALGASTESALDEISTRLLKNM
jgi:hypothetical protein